VGLLNNQETEQPGHLRYSESVGQMLRSAQLPTRKLRDLNVTEALLAAKPLQDHLLLGYDASSRNPCHSKRSTASSLSYPVLENSMSSAKEAMSEIIAQQPDDSSYDEILRELVYAGMLQRGLEDSDAGRTLSDDEVKRKIDSWDR
jgi:predicted transcriptional regulator